eukprot:Colp12_sorted_trinity150504_noHs@978
MPKSCNVYGCKVGYSGKEEYKGFSVFERKSNHAIFKKWKSQLELGRKLPADLKQICVCERHFKEEDVIRESILIPGDKLERPRLCEDAIPVKLLTDSSISKATSTPKKLLASRRKRKEAKEIEEKAQREEKLSKEAEEARRLEALAAEEARRLEALAAEERQRQKEAEREKDRLNTLQDAIDIANGIAATTWTVQHHSQSHVGFFCVQFTTSNATTDENMIFGRKFEVTSTFDFRVTQYNRFAEAVLNEGTKGLVLSKTILATGKLTGKQHLHKLLSEYTW